MPLPVLALKAQAETTPGIGNPVLRVQFAQLYTALIFFLKTRKYTFDYPVVFLWT